MSEFQSFVFKSYDFDKNTQQLALTYALDDQVAFTETYHFDFPFVAYDQAQLDRALQNLFFMAGVSYYKAYLPPTIRIESGQLDSQLAAFFAKTYERGLGEFFYVNKLDPQTKVAFPTNAEALPTISSTVPEGLLVGLGGGKDSLVTAELLRQQGQVAAWNVDHEEQLAPLVERIGLPHFSVKRQWDTSLLEHNKQGAMNGHVPISAIFACVGTVVGILSGYKSAAVSNEQSANEPTLQYEGVAINHQYSKSQEFERDYQSVLTHCFEETVEYFSFLRPLTELRIAELFAKTGFEKYADVFSSCNRAFVHTSHGMSWCGECPKCAFVFLILTPFVPRAELEQLWNGKNLLLDPALEPLYRQLLGIEGDKPLECVGEIKESRAAMRLATAVYPELQKYVFDLPNDYDYRQLSAHEMPERYYDVLLAGLDRLSL